MTIITKMRLFSYKHMRRGFFNTLEVIISSIIILIASLALVQVAVLSPTHISSQTSNNTLNSLAYDTLQTGITLGILRELAYSNPLNSSLQTQATLIFTMKLPATVLYSLTEYTADGSIHPFNGRVLLGMNPPDSYHGQIVTAQSFVNGYLSTENFQQIPFILTLVLYGGSLT